MAISVLWDPRGPSGTWARHTAVVNRKILSKYSVLLTSCVEAISEVPGAEICCDRVIEDALRNRYKQKRLPISIFKIHFRVEGLSGYWVGWGYT